MDEEFDIVTELFKGLLWLGVVALCFAIAVTCLSQ